MPFYQYSCAACTHEFEKSLKIAERDEAQVCPECNSGETVRGVSAAPLIDPVRLGIRRPDAGWKEVLQKIHEKTPGSILKSQSKYL